MKKMIVAVVCFAFAIGVVCGNSEIENYRKAAEQGDAVAQRKLGYRYGNGIGVKQDHAEALRETVETGRMCYFSRSRQCLWRKGFNSVREKFLAHIAKNCQKELRVRTGG